MSVAGDAGPPPRPPWRSLGAAVGGDRVRGHVADHRRVAEPVAQRVAEARVARALLPRAQRPGRAAATSSHTA